MKTTTTAEKPEVRTLPRLDTTAVTAEAEAWVQGRVPDADAETVARAMTKIVDAEHAAAKAAKTERDVCAYTLMSRYNLKRGSFLDKAMGLESRSWLTKVRKRYGALDSTGEFTPTPDAVKALPRLSRKAALHAAREDAAIAVRDDAVEQLIQAGRSNAAVGELLGRDQSRVSHIKFNRARDDAYDTDMKLPDGRSVRSVVDGHGSWKKALDSDDDGPALRAFLRTLIDERKVA